MVPIYEMPFHEVLLPVVLLLKVLRTLLLLKILRFLLKIPLPNVPS